MERREHTTEHGQLSLVGVGVALVVVLIASALLIVTRHSNADAAASPLAVTALVTNPVPLPGVPFELEITLANHSNKSYEDVRVAVGDHDCGTRDVEKRSSANMACSVPATDVTSDTVLKAMYSSAVLGTSLPLSIAPPTDVELVERYCPDTSTHFQRSIPRMTRSDFISRWNTLISEAWNDERCVVKDFPTLRAQGGMYSVGNESTLAIDEIDGRIIAVNMLLVGSDVPLDDQFRALLVGSMASNDAMFTKLYNPEFFHQPCKNDNLGVKLKRKEVTGTIAYTVTACEKAPF